MHVKVNPGERVMHEKVYAEGQAFECEDDAGLHLIELGVASELSAEEAAQLKAAAADAKRAAAKTAPAKSTKK